VLDSSLVASLNAFHVLGGLLAAWAVGVTALGLLAEGFPSTRSQAWLVGATSVLLAAAAIGSGIITSALEEEEEEGEAAAEPAAERAPPSGEAEAPAEGGGEIALAADPGGDLAFDKSELEAAAGRVTITMENASAVPHDVSLTGGGVDERGKVVQDGGTSTVTATLEPGRYTFYCSVSGHRRAGMEGTLTVR
jgi:plastocyanin